VGFAILALLGACFIIVSSPFLFRIIATRRGGVRTRGWVIDNRLNTDSDGQTYAPVIRFNTQDGGIGQFVSDVYTPSAYEVGKQVPIVYQPSKPEQAILDTALGTWVIPTVFLVIGVVFFLLGLIGLLGFLPLFE
jgi:hypothetical protein